MAAGEHEVLALLIEAQSAEIAELLRSSATADAPALLGVAKAQALLGVVDDALRALVRTSRAQGNTWAEIGALLRTTRQAAFQRFGTSAEELPFEGAGMTTDEALDRAGVLFRELYPSERWSEMRAQFDERMLDLSEEMLAAGWQQLTAEVGEFKSAEKGSAQMIGEHIVVDVPLTFAQSAMKGRAAYNPDGTLAGLFILNPDVP